MTGRTTLLQNISKSKPTDDSELPQADPPSHQAQGRLWLTTALPEGEERDQDQSLSTPDSEILRYPLKGLPQEEVC